MPCGVLPPSRGALKVARVFQDPLPDKGNLLSVSQEPSPSPVKMPLEPSPPHPQAGASKQPPGSHRAPRLPPHPVLSLQAPFRTMTAGFSRGPLGPPRPPSAQTEGPCLGSSPAEHRPQP